MLDGLDSLLTETEVEYNLTRFSPDEEGATPRSSPKGQANAGGKGKVKKEMKGKKKEREDKRKEKLEK